MAEKQVVFPYGWRGETHWWAPWLSFGFLVALVVGAYAVTIYAAAHAQTCMYENPLLCRPVE